MALTPGVAIGARSKCRGESRGKEEVDNIVRWLLCRCRRGDGTLLMVWKGRSEEIEEEDEDDDDERDGEGDVPGDGGAERQ